MKRVMNEPGRLLESYEEHLNENGGILSESVSQLIELMSSANRKLVPKCIALCIISSSSPEIQLKLCKKGAWDILLRWLQEALKEDNYAFLLELLNVYLQLPVRLEQLTQNVCPKLINSLTKRCEHEAVKTVATEIVRKWKNIISTDSRKLDQSVTKRKKVEPEEKCVPAQLKATETQKNEKKRLRTVKMLPTTMRTAGVEDNTTQPQPKSRSDVLAKKSKLEHDNRAAPELPIESFHQKITVTPTEPRKAVPELHESSDFINALTTVPCPVVRKKRKLSLKSDLSLSTDVPVKEESSADVNEIMCTDNASPSPTKETDQKKSSLASIYSTFSDDSKPKKRVSWADEDKLQSFFYFELDESERVNVNRVSLEEIRRKELSMERQHFKGSYDDFGVGPLKWYSPRPLERIFLVEPGYKSIERQIQAERERYVLQAIYFTRESIPASPEEPDPETVEPKAPLNIPLDDLTVYEATEKNVTLVADKLLVVKDAMGNPQMSLNPEVANLVKSLAANLTGSPKEPLQTSQPQETSLHLAPSMKALTISSSNSLPSPVRMPSETEQDPFGQDSDSSQAQNSSPPVDQMLQRELWEVLEQNYPDINVHDLSAERIRDLLEPLRDQLVARGIFQFRNTAQPPSSPYLETRPEMRHPYNGPRPLYSGLPPPSLLPSSSRPDFRPFHGPRMGPPLSNGFRGPPGPRPMRFPQNGPPPPQFGPGPMPMCNGPPLPPPGHRNPLFVRGPNRMRGNNAPCKFYHQGGCRNGPSCTFMHSR